MDSSVRIMKRKIERRTTNQRRQSREWIARLAMRRIKLHCETRKDLFLKIGTDFKWVTGLSEVSPCSAELDTELRHRLEALSIGSRTGPCPLDIQRCLAPAFSLSSETISDGYADSRTTDLSEDFRAKLKRDAGL